MKTLFKKKNKTINIKITTNNYQQLNLKNKNKLRKQLEQEQNHRYGDHLEGYQLGNGMGRMEEKMQGLRSIIGRYKINRGMLRTVQEIVKPKNFYA